MTWLKGKHTLKAGGSLTLRSREILNADSITGDLPLQQQQDLELRRLSRPAARSTAATGFDVASFLLGIGRRRTAPFSLRRRRSPTYTEKRPGVLAVHAGRLPRQQQADAEPRPAVGHLSAVGRGRQQAVELRRDDRASSSSRPTARPSAAWTSADTSRPTRRPTSGRGSASPTISRGDGKTIVRGGFGMFWNFSPGGTSSSKAQNQPFLQSQSLHADAGAFGNNLLLCDGTAATSGRASRTSRRRAPRVRPSRSASATRTRALQPERAARARHQLPGGGRLRRHAGPADDDQDGLNQAPPIVGVSDANVNRPFIAVAPSCSRSTASRAIGTLDYNGLLLKFQRRFANNFSFLNSYTYGQALDLSSDNDGRSR